MQDQNTSWLPYLSSEIVTDARGSELDAYVIALEGWRRGLELRWHVKDSEKFKDMKTWATEKPGKLFSLTLGDKTHYFFKTRGDKVSNEAVTIGADKETTKKHVLQNKLKTPLSMTFSKDSSIEEINEYVENIGYPVVVKPVDGSFGKHVYTNINTMRELQNAINKVARELDDDILVEQFIQGEDYRIYVVDDAVAGAIKRIPANIVGNGINSIKQLIDQKNEERKNNPRLISCPIKVNQELVDYVLDQGYTFDEIPAEGQQIFLTNKSNISLGGDPVDVLDELDDSIRLAAVDALKAIPDLPHGAVDIIVQQDGEQRTPYVLEINPTAQIGSLIFPMKGQARDVPAAIIDYYFPETKGEEKQTSLYFDLGDMLEPLISKVATVTKVSKPPIGKVYGRKFIVSGDVQGIDYHRGLRKQAFERRISGFISKLHDGRIEIVVISNSEEMLEEFKESIKEDPERSTVEDILEEIWDEPVKIGFEIKADYKTQLEYLKELNDEMNQVKKELKQLEGQYNTYQKSMSWRITAPFRRVSDVIKLFYRLLNRRAS
ncbi:ATP-grasp domain-containing protein [Gracilibacillus salitolerans]|uniref:Acylphosphatase n=1 Tax=Gracilibacillus salitolerans TaxID=2663022 RepID=A0A5Q2TRG6_9BACI|nr:acylphosphatase [Gracilibacillus salitolerans]QGH36310.1 ATP-grasp domain-containing protein [Gracilibacillus salitolerans]